MITRLQVRGFKSLLDIDVEFGPLTVFVGANGSGKTSVLEAIDFLRDLAPLEHAHPRHQIAFPRVLSRQGITEIEISSTTVLEGRFQPESFEISCPGIDRKKDREDFKAAVTSSMRGVALYRLDADAMAKAAYSDDTHPRLEPDGTNLAVVLDALQGEARERFDEIERKIREFVPSLRRLRVKRVRTDFSGVTGRSSVVGHQVAFDFEHASDIGADEASEGTLLLLGLLTIIEGYDPGEPITIMLDDLDRALHPSAQRELIRCLHGLIKSRPGLQIIATTHSPYLVEHLEFEEVRAITQAPDGSSVIASLTDHPEAKRWREEMSAGEFWSSVGEGWVATERSGA